jgi:acetyl-CoA C-acetyltransferase/acetyl-CoA acyltransferase
VPVRELGRAVTRELLDRTGIDPRTIDEVVFGCAGPPADSANPARVIALRSGIPAAVPAFTVGRNCASGLEAVTQAVEKIRAGRADTILVGGIESMSRYPLEYPRSFARKTAALARARGLGKRLLRTLSYRPRDFRPVVTIIEGLTDPVTGEMMGATAERLAREFAVSRAEQDECALASHRRAVAARDFHAGEIAPVAIPPRFEERLAADAGPRENQTIEALGRLRPWFDKRAGTVTVGNSCPVTDGAVALILMAAEKAAAAGLRPLGRVLGHAYRGLDPLRMGLGPVHATVPALAEAGVSFADLAVIELNEAFAAQVLACCRAFASADFAASLGLAAAIGEVDPARLNPNGGAIALGHPVGATGARLVLTALREVGRRGGFALATLCIGGGQGGAVVLEGMPS